MYLDVIELRNFYAGPCGRVAAPLITAALRRLWPDIHGHGLLGLGFASPYLDTFAEAGRRIALMPAPQGVIVWPPDGPNRAALVDEDSLPLADAAIERILVVHSLECSDSARRELREIWRVLAPGGRAVFIIPNRRGIWARTEKTPFGHGHPYSRGQLRRLLGESMFTPLRWSSALHMPPARSRPGRRLMTSLEQMGRRLWPNFAGVLLVEAEKRIYAKGARLKNIRQPRRALARDISSTVLGRDDHPRRSTKSA